MNWPNKFAADGARLEYLFTQRWLDGSCCPKCQDRQYWTIQRPHRTSPVYESSEYHHQTSAETKVGYGFFDDDRVTPSAILAGHRDAMATRVGEHEVILAVKGTTTFNFISPRKMQGMVDIPAATRVPLKPPQHRRPEHLPSPTVTAMLAREDNPPEYSVSIEWMLLTTLSVQTLVEAATCLRWYSYRWRIERYHYVLKSGCQVEELQVETCQGLKRAIAVYRIVVWHLLWMTYRVRVRPEAPCTTVLHPVEWSALYAVHIRTSNIPDTPIGLHRVRWKRIAQLGGFLTRRVKVLWRGYQRLQDPRTFGKFFIHGKLMGNA